MEQKKILVLLMFPVSLQQACRKWQQSLEQLLAKLVNFPLV